MRRIVGALVILYAIVGCDAITPKKPGELTSKQRADWDEKRKEVADYPYLVVGYDADEKAWMTCVYSDPKLVKYDWKRLTVDLWHKDSKSDAFYIAKDKADNPAIAATAVVNLVEGEDPKPILWYYKKGDQMNRATGGAPRADLGVSLKEYLRFIQTNPGMVKIPEQ